MTADLVRTYLPLSCRAFGPSFKAHGAVIPEPFRSWQLSASEAQQVPVEALMLADLVIVGALCSHRYDLELLPTWKVSLNAWALIVQDSGEGKSRASSVALGPIHDWEHEQFELRRRDVAIYDAQVETLKAEVERARKAFVNAKSEDKDKAKDNLEAMVTNLATIQAKPVRAPRLTCDDVTPERLAGLLNEQGERILVDSTEGGTFDIMSGRYAKNGGPNLEVYLKSFSGDPVQVDRMNRERISLRRPLSSMYLMTQNTALDDLGTRPYLAERGILPRFWFYKPDQSERRWPGRPGTLDPSLDRARRDALLNLLSRNDSARLGFEAQAEDRFFAAKEMWAAHAPEEIKSWAKRMPEYCAKLSGILHIMEHASAGRIPPEISVSTFDHAYCIVQDFLLPHASVCLLDVRQKPTFRLARRAWEKILTRGWERFSFRDLQHALGCPKTDLEQAVLVLLEDDRLELMPKEARTGPGQRPGPVYKVIAKAA